MEKRKYGSHDVYLSTIGFGGIVVKDETQQHANELVAQAVERGINYFDVAPAYGDAQQRLGPALEPYRKNAFLACKTNLREADDAEEEFRRSLRDLRTDYLDLYQMHAIQNQEDVDRVLAPGGTLELFRRLKEEGAVRFLGFSAHNEDAALRLLDAFPFDSVLFPVNWAAWFSGDFGPRLIEKAEQMGAAVLALKALADRRLQEDETRPWPKSWYKPVNNWADAQTFLRFTLSQPVTAAVSPGHEELLWWACDAADDFTPLNDAERDALQQRAAGHQPIFSRTVTAI
jgi:aryl-alcohol dehydrogenase-like predicted oxidoreductase